MTFLAAGWLGLLLPWAALVAWVWRRIAQEQATTAAFLWTSQTIEAPRDRSRSGRPPAWVIAGLLAMLAAIVALAGPARRGRGASVSIILDGSISLAARAEGRTLRDDLLDRCHRELLRDDVVVTSRVRLAGLPAPRTESPDGESFDDAHRAAFTTRPTEEAIRTAIESGLRESDAVIVLTDKPIETKEDRVAVRVPTATPDNVGIVSAIAVERPRPSLMVTIANDSDRREAVLELLTKHSVAQAFLPVVAPSQAGMPVPLTVRQTIALPTRGERKKVFIDLDAPVDVIEIVLDVDDSLSIDNTATLLRTRASPRLVVDAGAPEVAARFATAYERAKPARGGAAIRLSAEMNVDPAESAIIFGSPTREIRRPDDVVFFDHPIHRDLVLDPPHRVAQLPSASWRMIAGIASVSDAPILAVRDSPARSVWIGFDLVPNDARSVILLANAVDWITESFAAEWTGEVPAAIGEDWKPVSLVDPTLDGSPGIYANAAGRHVVANVPAVVGPRGTSRGDIVAMLRRADRATLASLQKPLAFAAALLACVSAALFGRRRIP